MAWAERISILVVVFFISLFGLIYRATFDSASSLSPQGCRMSYMSPSYIVQSAFDTSWTPLATRYSLLLYREVGWEDNEPRGVPVLFIPGNAGSSHQIRSIASSAARQYYASPHSVSPDFASRVLKPLDFFAVEYNEDLSAFHGPTLDAETAYASSAISYILSLYPSGTSIIVMAHSMGGIVATSLLPSPDISAVITMSTPHTLPPARFDRRIAAIYNENRAALSNDSTPILSLCGGATDLMVPSESCILPEPEDNEFYRRTIFSSALEGCWTGVGHQVMVWCHQVRWRVARAALELGATLSPEARGTTLDRWLRDGRSLPRFVEDPSRSVLGKSGYTVQPPGPLVLREFRKSKAIQLMPVPEKASPVKFVAYVSQGSVLSMAPHHASSLSASFFLCTSPLDDPYSSSSPPSCEPLHPASMKLIPNPVPDKPFPIPHEGIDESEGVVLFEAMLPEHDQREYRWVAIWLSNREEKGWIIGGFIKDEPIVSDFNVHAMLYHDVSVPINPDDLISEVQLPRLHSNALLVYRVSVAYANSRSCQNSLLPPLLLHTSHSESHFHPLTQSRPLLLHTHTAAPFIPSSHARGINLTLYTSPDCGVESLLIRVDWWGTLGRIGARYWTAIPGWGVGIVAWTLFAALGAYERGEPMPSVTESLSRFASQTIPWLMAATFALSLLPLPPDFILGNQGDFFFSPLAPHILVLVTVLVIISWWVLCIIMWPIGKLGRILARRKDDSGISKNTILSMLFIFLLVAVIVPWQVAFLCCWIIHLVTCATYTPPEAAPPTYAAPRTPSPTRKPAIRYPPRVRSPPPHVPATPHDARHVLLLMTWLLPLVAPVLAVWVRTLATAGPIALGNVGLGDHSFLAVAPFLILVDYASWTHGALFPQDKYESVSVRWCLLLPAIVAFLLGARRTYEVFDWVWIVMSVLVVFRVGPRYLGAESWASVLGRSKSHQESKEI
ncbi:PGAP1-like protein-domain-containing protein [Gloeopeniophorella convolvens]|nr:PGAP1-like protein-domain-containing protein [Gloeopeniophorella convolvens]